MTVESAAEPPRFEFYDEGSLSVAAYDLIEDAVRGYGEDATFYLDLCRDAAGPVLDLGTGTGRVAWALADAGHAVVGVDLSSAMLERAAAKAAKRSPEVQARCRFVQGDMADFEVGQRFDRVLVPYRSFNHLLGPEQQIACLGAIRRHLAPGGRAAIHFAMLDRPDGMAEPEAVARGRNIRVKAGSSDRMVHWELLSRSVDLVEQQLEQEIQYTLKVIDGAVLRQDVETFRLCWITRREARHLLARCGFRILAEYGDFAGGPPRADADHVVVFEAAGVG